MLPNEHIISPGPTLTCCYHPQSHDDGIGVFTRARFRCVVGVVRVGGRGLYLDIRTEFEDFNK